MKCERCLGHGTYTRGLDPKEYHCPDCNGTGNQPESQEFPYECDDKDCTYYGLDVAEHTSCPENEITPDPPEESHEKPLQPVKNDYDERIRESFEKQHKPREGITFFPPENMYIFSGEEKAYHPTTAHVIKQDIVLLNARWSVWKDAHKVGFESRDEEVDWLRSCNHTHVEQMQRKDKEITAIRAQIEEMKCLYAENYRQLLNEAKSIYQHCPNNFRKTEDEYFLEENEFLAELEKEK